MMISRFALCPGLTIEGYVLGKKVIDYQGWKNVFLKAEYQTVIMNFKFKKEEGLPCIQASDGRYYCNAVPCRGRI